MVWKNRPGTSSKRPSGTSWSEGENSAGRLGSIINAVVNQPPDAVTLEQVRSIAGAVARLWCKLAIKPNPLTPADDGHSIQVASLSLKIARLMGLEEEHAQRIFRAAYLHDVGGLAVEGSIMVKPGDLTAEERGAMQVHPHIGCELLRAFLPTQDLAGIALSHHERFDGCGYPNGLTGTHIPLEARVLAIADSLDAMLSPRPYRHPLSVSKALDELTRGSGRQYDPSIVEDLVWKGKFIAWSANG